MYGWGAWRTPKLLLSSLTCCFYHKPQKWMSNYHCTIGPKILHNMMIRNTMSFTLCLYHISSIASVESPWLFSLSPLCVNIMTTSLNSWFVFLITCIKYYFSIHAPPWGWVDKTINSSLVPSSSIKVILFTLVLSLRTARYAKCDGGV